MKVLPQEVYLHGLGKFPDYVYSIDISRPFPDGQVFAVTGGADSVARVWRLLPHTIEVHSELQGHSLGVNCVRFSPDGLNNIATGSDDGKIVIWRPIVDDTDACALAIRWVAYKVLNTLDEVVHVSWSPCGQMIAGAAQREMSHLYNIHTGRALQRLDGHNNRVLGVAWDPKGQLIVSQSTDRSARVYARSKKGSWYVKAQLREVQKQQEEEGLDLNANVEKWKLFISESHFPSDPSAHFFRRPEFAPDGSMVLLPGGLAASGVQFAVHLFNRANLVTGNPPTASFITPCSPSIAVRFHPLRFKSFDDNSVFFYVFAVVTATSFYVLRSDKFKPIAFGTDIHCTALVDAAWSADATTLALCSTDGYMTLVKFDEGELGGVAAEIEKEVIEDDVVEEEETAGKDSSEITQNEILSEINISEQVVPLVGENTLFPLETVVTASHKRRITPHVVG